VPPSALLLAVRASQGGGRSRVDGQSGLQAQTMDHARMDDAAHMSQAASAQRQAQVAERGKDVMPRLATRQIADIKRDLPALGKGWR